MTEVFLKLVNMSISASWIIPVVLALRVALKKAPKWICVLLWGIVAVRLICPFSIESALSLIPSTETIPDGVLTEASFYVQTGIPPVDDRVNEYLEDTYYQGVTAPVEHGFQVVSALAGVWLAGMLLLALYTAVSYWRLYRKVRTAVRLEGNIFSSEGAATSFVLGFIRPRIYLPLHMDAEKLAYVVEHERAHIRRRDHWWKPLGFLILTIHWFNPLVWLAYMLLCRDIEMACDEKVIRELGRNERADYSEALLACSVNRRMIAACPLAFGEVGVKERVRSVLNYKKPAFWIILVAILACGIAAVCFLTDPAQDDGGAADEQPQEPQPTYEVGRDEIGEERGGDWRDSTAAELVQLSYYLELAAAGKGFQMMDAERINELLPEYGALLKDFSLLARESTDGEAGYIIGVYQGGEGDNPFADMLSCEYSSQLHGDSFQLLYDESEYDKLSFELFLKGEAPTTGAVLRKSRMSYSRGGDLIYIQPVDARISLSGVFSQYLAPNGREYITDAVSRGIALHNITSPRLELYLISPVYGEVTEIIPLTEDEAAAILNEERQQLPEGYGFAAKLCVNDTAEFFTDAKGVPQSVIDIAVSRCGYLFETPTDITGKIVQARLECQWLTEEILAEASGLDRLQEILAGAEFGFVGACGYGAKLTILLDNGKAMTLYKGTDGCDSIVFGSYGGYFIGDKENTQFWEIFGLDPETKEPVD